MLSISDLNSSHQLLDHHRLAKLILKAPSRTLRPTAIVMENSNQALADKMSATRSSSPILESSQGCLFQILGVNAMSNRQCGQNMQQEGEMVSRFIRLCVLDKRLQSYTRRSKNALVCSSSSLFRTFSSWGNLSNLAAHGEYLR